MDSNDNDYSGDEGDDNNAINNGELNDASTATPQPNNPRYRYACPSTFLFGTRRPYPAPYHDLQVRPLTPPASNVTPLPPKFLVPTIEHQQQQRFHPGSSWPVLKTQASEDRTYISLPTDETPLETLMQRRERRV